MATEPNLHQDPLKKWIKEAGTENPLPGFSLKVIEKISLATQKEYTPVISPFGWKMIATYIVFLFGLGWYFVPSEETHTKIWDILPSTRTNWLPVDSLNFNFPSLDLSPHLSFGLLTFFIMALFTIWLNNKQRSQEV